MQILEEINNADSGAPCSPRHLKKKHFIDSVKKSLQSHGSSNKSIIEAGAITCVKLCKAGHTSPIVSTWSKKNGQITNFPCSSHFLSSSVEILADGSTVMIPSCSHLLYLIFKVPIRRSQSGVSLSKKRLNINFFSFCF